MNQQHLANGATFLSLPTGAADERLVARAQNFCAEWIIAKGVSVAIESDDEIILVLPDGAAHVVSAQSATGLKGPSLAILPAGSWDVTLTESDLLLVLATDRPDLERVGEAEPAHPHDGRIAPVGAPFVRAAPLQQPLVMPFDVIANPSAHPRIRFLQSATMSINLVRYDGARDASALSPHAHDDIEQGTLAIQGDYVHHLRTPWGADVAGWREDEHIKAGPGTLLLIPPQLIHTTQGVGSEKHLMLDIFAPPRRDFIAKDWMANAADYRDHTQNGAVT